ncbi:MAG TPA: type II toxin-antitoxin system VapC family toxin [Candidatus Binatia bacterium]|nr:type II toxin-antitoxin system VapC family toxin [Candidatus Binatia bacterium]
MVILDTDHLTIIQRQNEPAYTRLRTRLQQTASDTICTTIVNVEEQMRGWLAVISRSRRLEHEIAAYRQLHALFTFFSDIPVLDFDESAAVQFSQLRRARLRLGSMDLKIAAIARSQNALLLSRNLTDFQRVPGLRVEDWTQTEEVPSS